MYLHSPLRRQRQRCIRDSDIRGQVRERVDGVCGHGGASSDDTRGELGSREEQIDDEPHEGYPIDLLFARFGLRLYFL